MLVDWPHVQPTPDVCDWSTLDTQLATRAAIGGKPVPLKTIPYGQTPIEGDTTGDNTHTPEWVYDVGVPRITFVGDGQAAGSQVFVPKVWDAAFPPGAPTDCGPSGNGRLGELVTALLSEAPGETFRVKAQLTIWIIS
jgi:hypothetical protein